MNETIRQEAIKRLGAYWDETSRMGEVDIDLLLHTRDMESYLREAVVKFSIARVEMLTKVWDVKDLLDR